MLTYEVAEGRVDPQVPEHVLGVDLFSFHVHDIFQILSGDPTAGRELLEDEIIVDHDAARAECLDLNSFKGLGEGRLEIQSLQLTNIKMIECCCRVNFIRRNNV